VRLKAKRIEARTLAALAAGGTLDGRVAFNGLFFVVVDAEGRALFPVPRRKAERLAGAGLIASRGGHYGITPRGRLAA
jgi:hypothetical protein